MFKDSSKQAVHPGFSQAGKCHRATELGRSGAVLLSAMNSSGTVLTLQITPDFGALSHRQSLLGRAALCQSKSAGSSVRSSAMMSPQNSSPTNTSSRPMTICPQRQSLVGLFLLPLCLNPQRLGLFHNQKILASMLVLWMPRMQSKFSFFKY